jgi:hypothetical protein
MTGRPFSAAVCLAGSCRHRGPGFPLRLAAFVRDCPHRVFEAAADIVALDR